MASEKGRNIGTPDFNRRHKAHQFKSRKFNIHRLWVTGMSEVKTDFAQIVLDTKLDFILEKSTKRAIHCRN
jgi:hypothetical protein